MDPFIRFLQDGTLPPDLKEARKIRYQAPRYILHEGKLYKRSSPFLSSSVFVLPKQTMPSEKCTKAYVEITWIVRRWHIKYFDKDITGLQYRRTRLSSSTAVTSASEMPIFSINLPSLGRQLAPLGHSSNRGWTF